MTINIRSIPKTESFKLSKTESRKEKLLESQKREEENELIVKEYIQELLAMNLAKRNRSNDQNQSDQVL